jgi:hypothetical protein
MALGGLTAAAAASGGVHASEVNERLLVSVMAMLRGDLVADDAATFTPFHRFKEQLITLDVTDRGARGTLLVTVWDKAAGGVTVQTARLDRNGEQHDRREFTMYPFVDKAAMRQERVRIPVVHVADDGAEEQGQAMPVELVITMKRAIRQR